MRCIGGRELTAGLEVNTHETMFPLARQRLRPVSPPQDTDVRAGAHNRLLHRAEQFVEQVAGRGAQQSEVHLDRNHPRVRLRM